MHHSISAGALCVVSMIFAFALPRETQATQPPSPTSANKEQLPVTTRKSLDVILNYNTTRGLTPLVKRAREERAAAERDESVAVTASQSDEDQVVQAGPAIVRKTAVHGKQSIPILTAKFADTPGDPIVLKDLQDLLFGPKPGTMTAYYNEVSLGKFTVTGVVSEWVKLGKNGAYYIGPGDCNGICRTNYSKLDEFVRDVLTLNDGNVDYAKHDNDGPDGDPNSGDDDGIVDFVAIVQPQYGGECRAGSRIWSHRYALTELTQRGMFETNDAAANGQKIRINDYVVVPAQSCKGTMSTIGVYCHEFGHAFGLPDLYDTDDSNGQSAGVGGWDLMGSGSMGDDGVSPSHMSAWSKEYLGWLHSSDIILSQKNVKLRASSSNPFALKIDIDDDQAYLLEYRRKDGFDKSLTGSGLLIWQVTNSIIEPGLANNRANADHAKPGLSVVEADDEWDLKKNHRHGNRGDAGDVFPGTDKKMSFDRGSSPAAMRSKRMGDIAICNIREVGQVMQFDVELGATARCEN
jgi:M6 family metalloprotease-like protein